jgi:hypothetical protein
MTSTGNFVPQYFGQFTVSNAGWGYNRLMSKPSVLIADSGTDTHFGDYPVCQAVWDFAVEKLFSKQHQTARLVVETECQVQEYELSCCSP